MPFVEGHKLNIGKNSSTYRHGMSKRPIHNIWSLMKRRCNNPTSEAYGRYGGRGIKVCDRWESFDNFYIDMGEPPVGTTLDRIDNDKGYEPNNCRWATREVQSRNRRDNVNLTHEDRTMCMGDWASYLELDAETLRSRLVRGWSVKEALTTPVKYKKGKLNV